MLHISTRGEAPAIGFSEALLTGLARDSGLYVPQEWPQITHDAIRSFAGQSYADVAKQVLGTLIGQDIAAADLGRMVDNAYVGFRHKAICPLVQLDDNLFLLELFHGPTLAFKDVAMQLLGQLMDHVLKAKNQRATIVGATSGDTGSAAVEAFKGLDQVDIFILFPDGRVSEVQRRQMTTVDSPNVHAIAVDGTFDNCQALVKAMFNHAAFRDAVNLSGVNSINWARVAAQAVYYFTSAVALGSPYRKVSFSVPTGNFGDIFAGWAAKQMGLPIDRLMIGTNANDILARTLATGHYEIRGVVPTTSPSMDIQISSNFERLLFDAYDRNPDMVRNAMAQLAQNGSFSIEPDVLESIRSNFSAYAVDEENVAREMNTVWNETGYVLDPHSAVGVRAARELLRARPEIPVIALSTAHPAKFPDAVQNATGLRPTLPLHLADLMERKEKLTHIANDISAVEALIRDRARILKA